MVCRRCMMSVREILTDLGIPFKQVSLGEAVLERPLKTAEMEKLREEFKKVGFEVIVGKTERVVNQIKSIVIDVVYRNKDFRNKNLSEILGQRLHFDYSHLSSVFSKIEGRSIQNFQRDIKIERIKELLEYDELSIYEIGQEMGYSSAAYLSAQFKKATGMTPSEYRFRHFKGRNPIDTV